MRMAYEHLLIFGSFMAVGWFLFICFWPRMMLYAYKRAILVQGGGDGPIPVNTLYTEPKRFLQILSTRPPRPQNCGLPA
jgi:hypothetical protein